MSSATFCVKLVILPHTPTIGKNRVYADFWRKEEFYPIPDQDIFNRFVSLSTKQTPLALNGDWSMKYVSEVQGCVSDRYVAKVEESGEMKRFGKLAVVTSDEEKGSD